MTTRILERAIGSWVRLVFGETVITTRVRAMRVLEEALELAQSEGVTVAEIQAITAQVYAKAADDPVKEFGGLVLSVYDYAYRKNLTVEAALATELERVMDQKIIDRVRFRNLDPAGDKIGLR